MQGKDKVQTEDFRKAIPDATMGWVLFQPTVKPFFVCDEDGAIFLKAPGFKTRYYAIESAEHAKALANRIFAVSVPVVMLIFLTWFTTEIILVALPFVWWFVALLIVPLVGYGCWSFAYWWITCDLRPHEGGDYRPITDDEFRDILRERGRVPR